MYCVTSGKFFSIPNDGITNAEDDPVVLVESSANAKRDPTGSSSITDNAICLRTLVFTDDLCITPGKVVSIEVQVQGGVGGRRQAT